jgi:hypothetical protein
MLYDADLKDQKRITRMPAQEFDPDAFLADQNTEFDPDAFLAEDAPTTLKTEWGENKIDTEIPGIKGRLLYKNLGGGDAGFNYLQKENPSYEWRMDQGEPVARKRDSTDPWQPLDSSQLTLSDISDIIYDIPTGAAEGAITTAGALGGGLPGAMGAGAVAGGANAALKQALGQYFGVNEINAEGILEGAGYGAMAPGVFGGGATANQVIKKAMQNLVKKEALDFTKKSSQQKVAAEALKLFKRQRGFIGKSLPGIAKLGTGVDKEIIERAAKTMPLIQKAKQNPAVRNALYDTFAQDVETASKQKLDEAGATIQRIKDKADQRVMNSGEFATWAEHPYADYGGPSDVFNAPYFDTAAYKDTVNEFMNNIIQNAASEQDKKVATKIARDLHARIGSLPEKMSANQMHSTIAALNDAARAAGFDIKTGQQSTTKAAALRRTASLYSAIAAGIRKDFEAGLNEIVPGEGKNFLNAMDTFHQVKLIDENFKRKAQAALQETGETDHKTALKKGVRKFLTGVRNNSIDAQTADMIEKQLGINVKDTALTEAALQEFVDNKTGAVRSGAGRALGAAAGAAASGAMGLSPYPGWALGGVIGGGIGGAVTSRNALGKIMGGYSNLAHLPEKLMGETAAEYLARVGGLSPYMLLQLDEQNSTSKQPTQP